MKSDVTLIQGHLLKRLKNNLQKELPKHFKKGDKVCIKAHMGEYGNLNYIRPSIVGAVVEELNEIGAKPFLFDSPVAYPGSRATVDKYQDTARKNGFTEGTMGCPIVSSKEGLAVKSKFYEKLEICKVLAEADGLLVLSHFKGHELANFGGAIKNLGMGALPPKSKSIVHSALSPAVEHPEKCTECGTCVKTCPEHFISLKDGKPYIKDCWGCGACIFACPNNVLKGRGLALSAGLAEVTKHVLAQFNKKKLFFINVLLDIVDNCDCMTSNKAEQRVCPNIGILFSNDPVAIDKASLDLANKMTKGAFGKTWPADENLQIEYGIKFKLGNKDYELKKA